MSLGYINPKLPGPFHWHAKASRDPCGCIEGACTVCQNHNVTEIARSDAGAKDHQATSLRVTEIIEGSKATGRKSMCFITGFPGAGNTLTELNIATTRAM